MSDAIIFLCIFLNPIDLVYLETYNNTDIGAEVELVI